MQATLLYVGAGAIFLWGVGHLVPTRNIVSGFGALSPDNRRIITMEWIVEGIALISTASFVAVAAAIQPEAPVSSAVYAVAISTLILLSVVSLFTGFKVALLPFRLCPLIFGFSAVLIAWGAWL